MHEMPSHPVRARVRGLLRFAGATALLCVSFAAFAPPAAADATVALSGGALAPVGKVAFATDRNGAVAGVVVTPSDGERLTVTGDAITFAEGATISFLAPGELEFQNAVTAPGDITVVRPDAEYLEWNSPCGVVLNSSAYKKIFVNAGPLEELTLVGFTASDGVYTVVTNRPYATGSSTPPGLPSGDYIHQLSHGNLYDGTSTKALRVQLAQPVGSNDIYARLTQYAVVGGNSFNAPKVSEETGATTPDASNQPVSRLVLARKGKGFATVRFRGTTDLNGGAVVYREDGYPTGDASDGYIESDGTGNVNTFFHPEAGTSAEVDFSFTELESSAKRIIGDGWWMEYQHDSTKNWSLYVGSASAVRDKTTGNAVKADTARHVVAWDDTARECRLTTAGEVALTLATPAALPASTTSQTLLFGPGGFISKAKIYRATFAKNGAVERDYLPCVKDGVPGFKDQVTGLFTTGTDSASFTAGGSHLVDADDAYVESDDTSRMIVPFQPGPDYRVEIDFALKETTLQTRLFGDDWWSGAYVNGSGYWSIFACGNTGGLTVLGDSSCKADLARHTLIIDDAELKFHYLTGATTNFSVAIPASQKQTALRTAKYAIFGDGLGSGNTASARIYRLRLSRAGTLEHDYVPAILNNASTGWAPAAGFKDLVTGGSIAGETPSAFTAGGCGLHYENDYYVEGNGTDNINTTFNPSAGARAEVDFALTELQNAHKRIFGDGWWMEFERTSGGYWRNYINGNGVYPSSVTADTARHVVVIDDSSRQFSLLTGGATIFTMTTSQALPSSTDAKWQTRLFGPGGNISKARIYRARLSKPGVAYDFAPTLKNGVPGYRDRLAGGFISGATPSAFTFGGFGRDGNPPAAEDFTAVPSGATLSMQGASATLTAAVPGADYYEWLKNGEVIDGATGSSLTVAWRKGGGSDVYSVRGVQTVAGATVRSAAVSATIEFPPTAFVLIVR